MNPNDVALRLQDARALNVPAKNEDTCWRTAAIVGLSVLTLLVCGCSKGSAPEQTQKPQAQANTAPANAATEASALDEVLVCF